MEPLTDQLGRTSLSDAMTAKLLFNSVEQNLTCLLIDFSSAPIGLGRMCGGRLAVAGT